MVHGAGSADGNGQGIESRYGGGARVDAVVGYLAPTGADRGRHADDCRIRTGQGRHIADPGPAGRRVPASALDGSGRKHERGHDCFQTTVRTNAAGSTADDAHRLIALRQAGVHHLDETARRSPVADRFEGLAAIGWADLWRRQYGTDAPEFNRMSPAGIGFRLDHVFSTSDLLAGVRGNGRTGEGR